MSKENSVRPYKVYAADSDGTHVVESPAGFIADTLEDGTEFYLASDHDATVAELRAELERVRGELALLRQCAEDWKDMPCETRGLEDMEVGCCRACRARTALKATEPKAMQETYLGVPWPRIITPKEPV